MATVDRLYLDANIFVRLFEARDALADALGRLLLAGNERATPPLATSELTLAEVLVVPYRENNDRLIDIYDGWIVTNSFIETGPIDRSVLWYAALLRSQYPSLKLPDAIHVSTAIGMRCSHILTADRRLGDRYELFHTRYGMISGPAEVEVIRPEIEVVERLIEALQG
ncbi:MAG: PIN domain-containing protein [Bauldia sp.]|nr:PIN domain-containing protein [Bauldia sp.]